MWKRALIFILISFALGACESKREESREQTHLELAHARIKQGDHDSAIAILEELRREKTSEKIELTLASAYAGRAGIRVEKYWEFLAEDLMRKGPEPTDEPALVKPAGYATFPPGVRQSFDDLNDNLTEFRKLVRRVEKLPYLEHSKRADLHAAILVLTETTSRGARLYRGVLETILLRSAVQDAVFLSKDWEQEKHNPCSPSSLQLLDWTEHSRGLLVDITSDFSEAFPSQKKSLEEWRERAMSWEETVDGVRDWVDAQRGKLCKKPS